MADPVLKFPPEAQGRPLGPAEARSSPPSRGAACWRACGDIAASFCWSCCRSRSRSPGFVFYLNGGRYVGTDDAYVGAQKVLITPDISGKIDKVVVKEGQRVKQGDVLFEIDPAAVPVCAGPGEGAA